MSKITDHLKKHKTKYLIGAGVAAGIAVGVVTVVVVKRMSVPRTPIVTEPAKVFTLGSGEKAIQVTLKPSQAASFNAATEVIRDAPYVTVGGESLKFPDPDLLPLKAYDQVYDSVKDALGENDPLFKELFSVDKPATLTPVQQ